MKTTNWYEPNSFNPANDNNTDTPNGTISLISTDAPPTTKELIGKLREKFNEERTLINITISINKWSGADDIEVKYSLYVKPFISEAIAMDCVSYKALCDYINSICAVPDNVIPDNILSYEGVGVKSR